MKVGLTVVAGTTNLGAGTSAVVAGLTTLAAAGEEATAGLTSLGGVATGVDAVFCGGASGCCLLMIALSTSPGLEM